MIRNYFISAWRTIKSNKFFSLVNISGLALGLATSVLLLLWVLHEKSYDQFHEDSEQVFRINDHFEANGMEMAEFDVPAPLSVFARSMPQVESIVRIRKEQNRILANTSRSKVVEGFRIAYVDPSFLDVFGFRLLQGSKNRLFDNINSIAITRSVAEKIFESEDIIGEVLQFQNVHFTITAVLQDFPANSSIQFDALLPMGFYGQLFTSRGGNGDWETIDTDLGNYEYQVYVKLHESSNPVLVGEEITRQFNKAMGTESGVRFHLQNLEDIHLISAGGDDSAAGMVRIFLIVAILVLAIAAINYINLCTARAMVRAKEVAIRKVIGAKKGQLFLQFVLETTLLLFFALVVAVVIILLVLPAYNRISGLNLNLSIYDIYIWKVIGYAALGILLAASIYPAFLLSAFQPVSAMKGLIPSGIGAARMRKMLVIFQFSISVVLIVATLAIGRQLNYIRNFDLGYDKSYVFTVPLIGNAVKHIDALKNELVDQPGILNVSLAGIQDFSEITSNTSDIDWPGKPVDKQSIIYQAVIDQDFIPTMKILLLEGQNFTGTPADSNLYILNETAVKEMGLTPPYTGQIISFHSRQGKIAGVMKDFNYKPLTEKVSPLLFYNWWNGNTLYVRTTAHDAQSAIGAVERQYMKYAGDHPFRYSFLDSQFEEKYVSAQREGLLFNIFGGIAIFISCLGVLGFASFSTRQRKKEIGIRKVLGAGIGNIVQMLSKESIQLIIVSIVIATPIAWYAMNRWLQGFAYRIEMQWWMFAGAGLIAVMIAMMTVSGQAVRVAMANPAEALQSE